MILHRGKSTSHQDNLVNSFIFFFERVHNQTLSNKTVRNSKGEKDRATMLPQKIIEPLKEHLNKVKIIHNQNFKNGFGSVFLPYALERKSPNAGYEWGWQYVFPTTRKSTRSGIQRRHHLYDTVIQKAVKQAIRVAGIVKHAN
jgi:integrase